MPVSDDVARAIGQAAQESGLDPQMLHRFVQIESGGNPYARSGSYMGLLQLGPREFRQYGSGDPFNTMDNLRAGARKIAAEAQAFRVTNGRDPSPTDLYLQHQQGTGGYAAHMANPELPAWQNMLSTGEGQEKGAGWAKRAIWGNVPDDVKRQFGSVDNLTSRDFVNLWRRKVEGTAGLPTEAAATGVPYGAIESEGTGPPAGGTSTVPSSQNASGPYGTSRSDSGGVAGLLGRALGISPGPTPAAGVLGIPGQAPGGIGAVIASLGGAPYQPPQPPPFLQLPPLSPIQFPAPIRRPMQSPYGGQ
jgi:hypothetical protein